MMISLIVLVAVGFVLVERLWPAGPLPPVRGWWARVVMVNLVQLGIVLLSGISWDGWLARHSLFRLRDHLGDFPSALITYLVSTFVYYWWHRLRHESHLFWRLCHQLHHSPRRIEVMTSFYKHPVEILFNSVLSSAIVYSMLGCSVGAAAGYTFLAAVAEFFYHWNVRTPHWLGFLVQRPESHRVHHQFGHHTQNFADLPIWDMLFGTFWNPRRRVARCGFHPRREDRLEDLLAFRDVNARAAAPPLQFLPTCIGCRKRWACRGPVLAQSNPPSASTHRP